MRSVTRPSFFRPKGPESFRAFFIVVTRLELAFIVSQGSRSGNPSMKPGRVKEELGVDWFTLLFEFPRAACASHSRGLIQRCDESHSGLRVFLSGLPRVARHLNQFPNLPFSHSSLTAKSFSWLTVSPWSSPQQFSSCPARVKLPRGYRFLSRGARAGYPAAWPSSVLTTSGLPLQWRSSYETFCRR